jgi:hypothetical protein
MIQVMLIKISSVDILVYIDTTRTHTITSDDLITHKAQVSKQLVVMCLTVSQALLLVVAVTQEWLLTLGAHKMLHKHINSNYLLHYNRDAGIP